MNLDAAIDKACRVTGSRPNEVRKGDRTPRAVQARRLLAIALHDEGTTEVEIKKLLGYRSQSNVSVLLSQREKLLPIDIDIVRAAL